MHGQLLDVLLDELGFHEDDFCYCLCPDRFVDIHLYATEAVRAGGTVLNRHIDLDALYALYDWRLC